MDDGQLATVAAEGAIFGRIDPEQKARLIASLRRGGRHVAMIGDGVNDVPALKQADLAIAMRSGSQAARGVADLVLLDDSFAALAPAFAEGQRIMAGMRAIVALFLVRSLAVLLLIVGAALAGAPFPITPKHNAVLALLTVGVPTLALAVWARPAPIRGGVLRSLLPVILPAALTIAPLALGPYLAVLRLTQDVTIARTALTTTLVFCGLLLISFVQPPTSGWVGAAEGSGDWKPTILAASLGVVYLALLATPALRQFFELAPLDPGPILGLAAVGGGWMLVFRWLWRSRAWERALGDHVLEP
jgi:cation-transporting ATPase E